MDESINRRNKPGRRLSDNIVNIQLASEHISYDTINTLTYLLKEAKKGTVIGITFAAIRPKLEYDYGFVGAALTFPELSIGMITRLKQRILEHIKESD